MASIKNRVKKLYKMYHRYILLYRFKKKVHKLNTNTDSYGLNNETREKEIIVSLTSYPARLNNLHYTIKSILCQTVRPDKLTLYLGEDCVYKNLPDSLRELERYGLQISMRPGNLKPHKKYYYAIKENPDSLIITIDDDCIYSFRMIEKLYSTYQRFPDCIIACRGHKILFDETGKTRNYMDWEWEYQKENSPSIQVIATGGAGVLYPPGLMEQKYLFQTELIQTLSPTADDLWLKIMQVLKGTKVVLCERKIEKERINFDVLLNEQTGSLQAENVHQNMNNVYMKRLMKYFKLTKDNFIDKM